MFSKDIIPRILEDTSDGVITIDFTGTISFLVENNIFSEVFYSIVSIPLIYLIFPILLVGSVFIIITQIMLHIFHCLKNSIM